MKVYQKLLLGLALVALLVGCVGYVAQRMNRQVEYGMLRLSENAVQELHHATEMTFALRESRAAAREFVASRDTVAGAALAAQLGRFEEHLAQGRAVVVRERARAERWDRAADIAASLGIVVVASAGNEGDGSWHYITAPADADSVITVGAVRADSTRASFSSFGPTSDGRTKPDVVAMGVNVWLARPGNDYGMGNGTSFSAPAVAGVVAQILQANPALDPIAVRDVLRATAGQADDPDNERGWGVVNAAAAVQQAIVLSTEDPVAAPVEAVLYPTVVARGRGSLTMRLTGTGVAEPVTLRLYDVLGRRVAVLYDGPPRLGPVPLALPSLPAGVYFYRFTGGALDAGGRVVVQ